MVTTLRWLTGGGGQENTTSLSLANAVNFFGASSRAGKHKVT